MPFQGDVRDFSVFQVFSLIDISQLTGILTIYEPVVVEASYFVQPPFEKPVEVRANVRAGSERARFYFIKGHFCDAIVTGQDNTLTGILAQASRLNGEQRTAIDATYAHLTESALKPILIDAGYVTEYDLLTVLRKRLADILYVIFAWSDGLIVFEDQPLTETDRILVPLEIDFGRI